MGLIDDAGGGPIALDTVVFIYFIEEQPQFVDLAQEIFERVEDGVLRVVTSALTLLETLVVPYRDGNLMLANRYEALLTRSRGLDLVEVDRMQLKSAAQLRAHHRIKTPDALQLAAALARGCSAFVTNDAALPSLPGLRTILLDRYRA